MNEQTQPPAMTTPNVDPAMSDRSDIAHLQAACDHERVTVARMGDGSAAGRWRCIDCGITFAPQTVAALAGKEAQMSDRSERG